MKKNKCKNCLLFQRLDNTEGWCKITEEIVEAEDEECNDSKIKTPDSSDFIDYPTNTTLYED